MLFRHIRIVGTGSYVPLRIVKNQELEKKAPTNSQWVVDNLGIRERRIADENEFTSDLASAAGLQAIRNAGLIPNDIELIIVATSTPDRKAPSTACIVQEKIGMTNLCPAFDVAAVCSGFLYGLTIGAQFIESGAYKNVLVIGADTFSKITDWTKRECVFFGDGAGAAVLQFSNDPRGLFACEMFANGTGKDNFTVFPYDASFTMNGQAVYETGTKVLPQAIQQVLARCNLSIKDVAMVIPHQPSVRVLRKTAEILELPVEKMKMNMDLYANTAGATVPLLLDQVNSRGEIKENDLVAFAAVGAGWTWGAALYRWH